MLVLGAKARSWSSIWRTIRASYFARFSTTVGTFSVASRRTPTSSLAANKSRWVGLKHKQVLQQMQGKTFEVEVDYVYRHIPEGEWLKRHLRLRKDKPAPTFPSERWTIVMRSLAPQLLALLLGPPRARSILESRLWIVLQREAPDPNRSRMLLLERAQSGVLQHDLVAA